MQKAEEDPRVEVTEGLKEASFESQPQVEQVEKSEKQTASQRIISLQRNLIFVTNIQTAVDGKESKRRTELEEARRIRLELLEKNEKFSQETFEEVNRGWLMAKEKVIPQELQEVLNSQQQLCSLLLGEKKKLSNDLQQELKAGDDRYVKDLRRQAEELDLMMERMDDQLKTLTKTYREEVTQIEQICLHECEDLLARDKTEWEQRMQELMDKELERLTQRKKTVNEYEATIHNLMLETIEHLRICEMEQNAKFQALERERQWVKADNMIVNLKRIRQNHEMAVHKCSLYKMNKRLIRLNDEVKHLEDKSSSQGKQLTKKSHHLSKHYK
nr:dynein regulatory complex protein 1-like isoform X3 [Monopterus albus]